MKHSDRIATGPRRVSRRRRAGYVATLCLIAPWLSACAAGAPPTTFDLTAPAAGVPGRPLRGQLVVSEPTASTPLDSDRIIIRTGPQSLALLKGTQWVEPLPHLVQSRLIQTFENGHMLRSVGYPGEGISGSLVLNSEIRRFEVDATTGQATVEIAGKLVDANNGRILAAQIFSAAVPGSAADGASASAALNAALGQVMKQIVAWSVAKV